MAVASRLLLVLSENWTMTPPRDLRALVRIAIEAEQADRGPWQIPRTSQE